MRNLLFKARVDEDDCGDDIWIAAYEDGPGYFAIECAEDGDLAGISLSFEDACRLYTALGDWLVRNGGDR